MDDGALAKQIEAQCCSRDQGFNEWRCCEIILDFLMSIGMAETVKAFLDITDKENGQANGRSASGWEGDSDGR